MGYSLNDSISVLSGVGEKKSQILGKMGIFTVSDLLRHFPRGYQNRGDVRKVSDCHDGENVSLILTVGTNAKTVMVRAGMLITKFSAFDDSGKITVVFFNNRYADKTYLIGECFRFFGKFSIRNGIREITSPVADRVVENEKLPGLVPVYPLTNGLTQKSIYAFIKNAVNGTEHGTVEEIIPYSVREKNALPSLDFAIRAIHCPESFEDIERARKYFLFEELYLFAKKVKGARAGVKKEKANPLRFYSESDITDEKERNYRQLCGLKKFTAALPYSLTNAQRRAIADIALDLGKDSPMRRMLCGDVGSGKTIVAAAAIFVALACGTQAMLMVPTEILANQHYNDLKPLLEKFGYKTALLTGAVSSKSKTAIKRSLENGECDLVIGTHALISDGVSLKKCSLVITDEQHRFGVNQREALSKKAKNDKTEISAHILVMSATPIPRSLAQTLYGDLSISILDELPPGRQKIDTYVVDSSYEKRVDNFILKQVKEGGQVYIICPLVDKKETDSEELLSFDTSGQMEFGDTLSKRSAIEEAERLRLLYPEIRVGCIYGKMKNDDKNGIMSDFASGNIDVLVSTTVIEVGVNVPNATLIVIRNAEMFGLAALHQLRGRVGRGKKKSCCILFSDSDSDSAKSRMNAMKNMSDGFDIANTDLEIRGPGDFIKSNDENVRQSGEFRFRFASLAADTKILEAAFEAAESTD